MCNVRLLEPHRRTCVHMTVCGLLEQKCEVLGTTVNGTGCRVSMRRNARLLEPQVSVWQGVRHGCGVLWLGAEMRGSWNSSRQCTVQRVLETKCEVHGTSERGVSMTSALWLM